MLFKNELHFCDELTKRVHIFTKNNKKIGEGELVIASGRLSKVEVDHEVRLSDYQKNGYFLCKSNDLTVTLLGCDILDSHIYPRIIVKGKKEDARFKELSIVLQGVSDWMDNAHSGEITKSGFHQPRETETFDISVKDHRGREFFIASEHWCSLGKQQGSHYLIEQYTVFNLVMKTGFFSLDDVIEKAGEMRTIFSLLLGFPLSVEYVMDTGNKRRRSIYFANQSQTKQPFESKIYCIADSRYIHDAKLWESIFKNFYQNKPDIFKNLWSRLVGNLENTGFWEHKILSYVSLVDRYVSIYAAEHDENLPRGKFRALRNAALSALSGTKDENSNEVFQAVVTSMEKQIETTRNSKFSSFRDCFDFTLSEMSNDIKDIIALKKEDFGHLKKIRDHVAHGKVPETKDGKDITYEVTLQSKLSVLLLYWAYRDFGFSDKDFAGFLDKRFNPILMRARLDEEAIDRVNHDYPCLNVTRPDFKKIKNTIYVDTILKYNQKSGNYHLCEHYSLQSKKWLVDPKERKKIRSIEYYIASILGKDECQTIIYISKAYVQNRGETHKVQTGLCILNPPEDLITDDISFKKIRYDESQEKWVDA